MKAIRRINLAHIWCWKLFVMSCFVQSSLSANKGRKDLKFFLFTSEIIDWAISRASSQWRSESKSLTTQILSINLWAINYSSVNNPAWGKFGLFMTSYHEKKFPSTERVAPRNDWKINVISSVRKLQNKIFASRNFFSFLRLGGKEEIN